MKKYTGETGVLYKTYYATIDYGDGPRCAWCKKPWPSMKHIEKHCKEDKEKNEIPVAN